MDIPQCCNLTENKKCVKVSESLALKLLGVLELDDVELRRNAQQHIEQWSTDLLELNTLLQNSPISFLTLQKKRTEVQERVFQAWIREKERMKKQKV